VDKIVDRALWVQDYTAIHTRNQQSRKAHSSPFSF
jgi:hypothetical protein